MNKFAVYILFFVISTFFAEAQLCKRNVVDCKGICGRMTDEDSDGICDFSPRSADSPIPESIATAVSPEIENHSQAEKTNITQTEEIKSDELKVEAIKTTNKTAKELAKKELAKKTSEEFNEVDNLADSATVDEWGDVVEKEKVIPVIPKENTEVYPLIEISVLTLVLYLITWLLAKFKVFKISVHRKIWNSVLLITFFMSGILGLVLVFQLNYNILDDWYLTFLELHVDFGIAMALISIFHVLWHTKYFLTLFKTRKKV